MSRFIAAIEVDRRGRMREDQLDRLTRQLREANAKIERAFDQGAAMVVAALKRGATVEEVERKIRWELVEGPSIARAPTLDLNCGDTDRIAIPLEFCDSDEHTEPGIDIPFIAEGTK